MTQNNKKVIQVLNEVLVSELTSINQYFLHGEMCRDWGYQKLYAFQRKSSIDEMRHAEELIERILYLKGIPNVMKLGTVKLGKTVDKQFELDSQLEREAITRLNRGIETCRAEHDNGSADLLQKILNSEESHYDWLESQLHMIREIGLPNYLTQQMGEAAEAK